MQDLAGQWQTAFLTTLQRDERAALLKQASLDERLGDWTRELTALVVATCSDIGWTAAAKKHLGDVIPVRRNEYLSLDIMAFPTAGGRWRFPIAVYELENSRYDDVVAYSLWKVLCTRAALRIVFCYRRTPEAGANLVSFIRDDVVLPMTPGERLKISGQTILSVGSRDRSGTFPYDFFRWWQFDLNTGNFVKI